MNSNYVDITVILDRSGSMAGVKGPMEEGLNKFFEEQKKSPGICLASLYQFDEHYETVFEGKPIAEVPKVRLEPRGMTALHDAIGKTITSVGIRLEKMPYAERPGKVIIVIITDGLENSSKEFTHPIIMALINGQRDIYKWEFVYLGANQDALQVGQDLGIAPQASMTFDPSQGGIQQAMYSTSAGVLRSRSGASLCADFSSEDREKQNKFLNSGK